MKTYNFEQFDVELTDPTITISWDNVSLYSSNMTISVDLLLETAGAKFGIRLDNVSVDTLDYDETIMTAKILTRLEDFEV